MEKRSLQVRKGAWTKEEDVLLTKCIHKFGEGRWHLVPLRAGLNRCRKSCRLRWLNYLSPNVKRGLFSRDEVDLIVRLHKLLGNRWSLIAGRIPGRTANDIKNFWNTHMHKKSSAAVGESHRATITQSSTIRPQPRNFSSPLKLTTSETSQLEIEGKDKNNETRMNMLSLDDYQLAPEGEEEDECIGWWANLLKTCENESGERVPFSFPEDEAPKPMMLLPGLRDQVNNHAAAIDGGGLSGFEWDVMFGSL